MDSATNHIIANVRELLTQSFCEEVTEEGAIGSEERREDMMELSRMADDVRTLPSAGKLST